jgi:hypothetical protein
VNAYIACVAITVLAAGVAQADEAPATQPSPIAPVSGEIVIDGKLDEPSWKSAAEIPVDCVSGKLGERTSPRPMVVRYAWDNDHLYIGYEVFDTNVVAVSSKDQEGPPSNRRPWPELMDAKLKVDVVEFFVSFGDPHFFWEIHHNAGNALGDIWVAVPDPSWRLASSSSLVYGIRFMPTMFMDDDGERTIARAVQLKSRESGEPSSINDDSDTDTGYTGEIRIPWRSLGAPADWLSEAGPGGQTLSILAVVQNGDLENRYHTSSPTFKGSWFHHGYADWPVYRLKAGEAGR